MKKQKPLIIKGKITQINNLGYINAAFCPKCKRHLFSYYDKDITDNVFSVSYNFNYCPCCGLHLDLDNFKHQPPEPCDRVYNDFLKYQVKG